MSIYKELSYENYIEQVKGIRFCILGPNEIRRMSVAEITKTDTYLGNDPVINGLFDPRMGVLDHNKLCHTCEQKIHFALDILDTSTLPSRCFIFSSLIQFANF